MSLHLPYIFATLATSLLYRSRQLGELVMGLLDRIAGIFTKNGRDDSLLMQGLAHAKAKRPTEAIAIYNRLLDSRSTSDVTRARALFNRALAYSALDDDTKALADLERVLSLPELPDNVQSAARTQIARVRRRAET